jgi:pseudaminic acid synthase
MKIGKCNLNEKCFIIAELSANHNGNLNTAIETIKAAREVGADAIKFQTYTADTITLDCKKDDFKIKGTVWHAELFRIAREEGLECFSSPFDFTAVDFLEKLNVPAYKIASFEITDIPLIEYVAKKQKPIILSTGIASKDDIDLAIQTIKNTGNNQIALLKCTSSYPAPIEEANLSMIQQFEKDYGVLSGLSDHTLGIVAPVVAATLGAKIIEKHFILDRAIGGPDASFSLNKEEFAEMVKAVRAAESAVGVADYSISEKSKAGRVFSRSLYFCTDLKKGEIIDEKSIRSVRPGHGLHPKHFAELIGKKLSRDVSLGTATNWDLFEN